MEDVLRNFAPLGIVLFIISQFWLWMELCARARRIEKRVDELFDHMLIDEEDLEEAEESGGE